MSQLSVSKILGDELQQVPEATVRLQFLPQLIQPALGFTHRRRPPPQEAQRPDKPFSGAGLPTAGLRTPVLGTDRGEGEVLMLWVTRWGVLENGFFTIGSLSVGRRNGSTEVPVVQLYRGLAGSELVVGVTAGSNNSPRKVDSALGGRITFDGGGGSVGQTLGFTACPPVAQPELARAQLSSNSSRDGRGFSSIFFMLGSDGGQVFAGSLLDGPGCVGLVQGGGGLLGFRLGSGQVRRAIAPLPACPEAGSEAGGDQDEA